MNKDEEFYGGIMKNSDAKYKRIENYIINRIESGKLRVGDQIETEEEIAQKFEISQLTVNKALSNLAKDGYIHRIRGKGTFVDYRPIKDVTKDQRYFSLSEDIEKSGKKPGAKLLEYKIVSGKDVPKIAKVMKIRPDEKLHYFVRVRTADNVYSYLYTKVVPFIEIDVLENGSIWKFLAENGFGKTKNSFYKIYAKLPNEEQMRELNIDQYTPLLLSHHISTTQDGTIYNYSDTYYISDKYEYTYISETNHETGKTRQLQE